MMAPRREGVGHGRRTAWVLALGLILAGVSGGLRALDAASPDRSPHAEEFAHAVRTGQILSTLDTVRGDSVHADTLRTRADSLRARVLQRVQDAAVPGGRLPWMVSDADSLDQATSDTTSVGGVPSLLGMPSAARPAPGNGAQPTGRTGLPAGADSVMQALASLPGYRMASFEGLRMEYTGGTRMLLLLGQPASEPGAPAPVDPTVVVDPDTTVVQQDTALVADTVTVAEPAAAQPPPEAAAPAPAIPAQPARFHSAGIRLEADSSIIYDDATGIVRARGTSTFTPERGDPIVSRSLIYDVRASRGTALGAQTRYAEGAGQWFVEANMDSVEDGLAYGSRARFTSDDRPQPNSHFEASELKVVANEILLARSVRLHFQEVPVLWLPFIAQPLTSGRSSGLLTPRFSVNDIVRTSGSYERRLSNVGMYWAISDYADATLAGDWWSGQYSALTGSLRYGWARQFLGGDMAARHFWREGGRRDLAVSTRNNWEPTERTRASLSANYVSNTGLVRQNSLDPRELTSSINSQAGMQQRLDWGSMTLEARRQQFLTDDRIEMTLPSATLSISTFTLFPAGAANPQWYNNVTVGASSSFGRDLLQPGPSRPGEPFRFSQADYVRTQGSLRSNVSLANLSVSGNANYRQNRFAGVPDIFARPPEFLDGLFPPPGMENGSPIDPLSRPRVDYADAEVTWSTALSYQQRIIGTTSISPSLTLSGQFVQSDSIAAAQSFVEAPTRLSFGVSTQAELYGFFPGFGEFDAVRHKVTPSVSFSYAPEVDPSDLQVEVFGARALGPQKILNIGFNQTFEARRSVTERTVETSSPGGRGAPAAGDELAGGLEEARRGAPADAQVDARAQAQEQPADTLQIAGDAAVNTIASAPVPATDSAADPAPRDGTRDRRADPLDAAAQGFRSPPPSQVVMLLGLSTSAVTYDLVQADSTGFWLDGFTTTELRNTVRSDYLRGLNLSFSHLLFEDPRTGAGGGFDTSERQFRPHLSQVSLGFSLDSGSSMVRSLGRLFGMDGGRAADPAMAPAGARQDRMDEMMDDPAITDGFDSDRILPGVAGRGGRRPTAGVGMVGQGSWSANLNYSLRRPRESIGGVRAQMLNGTINFRPTQLLSMNWATAYDFETRSFTDHTIRVTRDMYDWEASFGFRQAVNGNWTFQFEVSLKANRDLRFDYEQRNLEGGFGGNSGIPGGFF